MTMGKARIGVIHGRFQPLHLGHLEYLLAGKERSEFLWIGIANPWPNEYKYEITSPHRHLASTNPFKYYDRLRMIRDTLIETGIPRSEFDIVPFPINSPENIQFCTPLDARYFVTIYDKWGHEKIKRLRSLGVTDIDVMWERKPSEKITTGTEVRELIKTNQNWEHLVPQPVVKIIKEITKRGNLELSI